MSDPKKKNRRAFLKKIKYSLILFALTAVPLIATVDEYGITYDEPIYMEAAWHIKEWLSLEPSQIFDRERIDRYWKTDPNRNIHPSGIKWLYLIAQESIFWEKNPYKQNSIFTILLFSLAIACFLRWWEGKASIRQGVICSILLLTIPRFFGHAHFPATDIPMVALMLIWIVCLDRTILGKHFWFAGILLGFFISIKITSMLLSIPILLLFFLFYRKESRKALIRIVCILLIGLVTFYIINPDWWLDPFARGGEFLNRSITRREWTPFTLYFMGAYHTYRGPFHYPFVIYGITTPLLHLVFMVFGLYLSFKHRDAPYDIKTVLLGAGLLIPFLILALPVSPTNDGVRYLLPAYPFAACFMAVGLERIWRLVRGNNNQRPYGPFIRWTTAGALLLLFSLDMNTQARWPPFELSYYNRVVGGLAGAHRRGFEMTYWWEILNDDVRNRLNAICAGKRVYFPFPPPDYFFKHMTKMERIQFTHVRNPLNAEFMVILGRPFVGFWERKMASVYTSIKKAPVPVWDITIDGVPLLRVYLITSLKKIRNTFGVLVPKQGNS